MENTPTQHLKNKIKELEDENKALREEVLSQKKQSGTTGKELMFSSVFKEIIDSISEAIYIQDKDGCFLDVNCSAAELYGYSREFFIGKTPEFLSAAGKNDLKAVKKFVKKAYNGELQRFKFWGINKAGKVFPKEVILSPGKYSGKKVVIAISRDITDSYEAKEALVERERMYDTLINNLPGMVYRCRNDEQWTMEYVSPGIKDLIGYKPEDLIKNKRFSYKDLIHKDDRKKVNDSIQEAIKIGSQFTIRYRLIDAQGNIKWVWEQGMGVNDYQGRHAILEGFITDVTEQKEQEEKNKEQTAKINAIVELLPDLIFIIDEKGYYIDVLADNISKLAMPPEKLIGSNIKDVFPSQEVDRLLNLFRKCLDTKKMQTFEYQLALNGNPMFFEARISPFDKDKVLSVVRDVTDRKENEKALIQAEKNFRRTLDESPLGMRIVSNDYKTIYANKAILDIYGYESIEELIKTPIQDRYTPESYKEFIERKKLRKKGYKTPPEYEISIVRNDGEVRHLMANRKEILWDGVKQSLVIYRDITQQKHAEKALKESEERFRSIYQDSSLGMYRTSIDGKILMSNPALVKMLGYGSFEELAESRDLSKPKYFSKRTPRSEFVKLIEEKQELTGYEAEWVRKDGSIIHVRVSAKAIKDKNGKTLYYDGTVEDITKHKLAEKALKESEEKFKVLVENAFNGIFLMKDRYYEHVNDKFCQITGYSREELTSKDFDFKILSTETGKGIVEKWHSARQKGVKKPAVYEAQIKTKKGEIKEVETLTMGIETEGEIKILGVIRDITERKQSQKLKEEIAVAKRSLEFKKNFLANMSHEIRTPLTGIIGMAEILSKTELTSFQKDYLNSLIYSTENLREIINQILDYSKIEAGEVFIKPKVFAIETLLKNAKKLFESICNKDIKLVLDVNPTLPDFIETDEQRVSQIVYNLISNAVKFTDKGEIFIRLKPHSKVKSNNDLMIRMEVEDTGIGIRKEVQKKLFKPFSQIEQGDTRNFDGTGLGLSICKELSELLGGEIGVESNPGEGSLFWFTFMAKVGEEPAVTIKEKLKKDEYKIPVKLKILHAEDKLVNQKVVSLMLNAMGCEVVTAKNGQEALEFYSQQGDFDMILMDIQMPVMDGITATKKLREKYSDLPPIIGLSANAFEGDREKYMSLGLDEYITKPVKEADLEKTLKGFKLK